MEDAQIESIATASFAPRTRSERTRSKSISFISTCPACGRQRSQNGYTRCSLEELLETDHTIDAYCIPCDMLWPISADERTALARALAGDPQPAQGASCGRVDALTVDAAAPAAAGDYAPNRATEAGRP